MIVRSATLEDAAAMAAVEQESWPGDLGASESDFLARIEAYSEGQLLVEQNNQVIAVCTAQRISQQILLDVKSYDAITDGGRLTGTHNANGDVYQLVGVGVARRFQGLDLGRRLVDEQIERARSIDGIKRIVGFTRPATYSRYPNLTIEEYLAKRGGSGDPIDPVLAFHLNAGARIVSVHAGFRPEDTQSHGYGILIEYPITPDL